MDLAVSYGVFHSVVREVEQIEFLGIDVAPLGCLNDPADKVGELGMALVESLKAGCLTSALGKLEQLAVIGIHNPLAPARCKLQQTRNEDHHDGYRQR